MYRIKNLKRRLASSLLISGLVAILLAAGCEEESGEDSGDDPISNNSISPTGQVYFIEGEKGDQTIFTNYNEDVVGYTNYTEDVEGETEGGDTNGPPYIEDDE